MLQPKPIEITDMFRQRRLFDCTRLWAFEPSGDVGKNGDLDSECLRCPFLYQLLNSCRCFLFGDHTFNMRSMVIPSQESVNLHGG